MSAQARSQRLLSQQWTAAGQGPTLLVPAGMIVLVKSAYAQNTGASGANIDLNAYAADNSAQLTIVALPVPAGGTAGWEGWFVLNPGDELIAFSDNANTHVWVSGAVLIGSPPIAPA